VVPPFILGIVLVAGLLALAPTRRMYTSGRSNGATATYFLAVWLLGILIAFAPRTARLLLPILVVLYVVPFINWRAGLDRLVGRPARPVRPPMKNVTPPADEATEAR
jgi:hypothetical protein